MSDHRPIVEATPCPWMTRRDFLAGLGASAAVAAGGYLIGIWGRVPPAAAAALGDIGPGIEGRTLVVVEMGGGNDGLNMVVPHAQPAYHDLRPTLGITNPIDLDGEVGLHPALRFVADRYHAGAAAIVEGLGYPDPDLSHFASMSTWWTGRPGSPGGAGWLGRYLDGTVGTEDPLAGIAIGPGPAPALSGDASFSVSIQDASGLSPRVPPWIDDRDELMAMWAGFAPSAVDSPDLVDRVRTAIDKTTDAAGRLDEVLPSDEAGRRRSLSDDLVLAAALIASDIAPRIVFVHGFGDFDTHEGQQDRHSDLMLELDEGLRTFFDALDRDGTAERVLVTTASEFGRRAAENGLGTDHGTAASHLVLGSEVTGGRYGVAPDLRRLDRDGNLVHTVDYRSLYATVLEDWLGVPHAEVLDAEYETLPILRGTGVGSRPRLL